MSFLNRLLGKQSTPPDPTQDWPAYQNIERIVIPHQGQFGDLKFGNPINQAKSFGKPSKLRWIEDTYVSLHYAQAGFLLDFEHERLAYFALFTNQPLDESDPDKDFTPTIICLQSADGKTARLSGESKRNDIEAILGKPKSIDTDSDETILYYEFGKITVEFELQANDGVLMRMNLFPS